MFLLDIDACVTATPADTAVFDSLDQAVAAWRESKGDTARSARPEPVTDYSQLGFPGALRRIAGRAIPWR